MRHSNASVNKSGHRGSSSNNMPLNQPAKLAFQLSRCTISVAIPRGSNLTATLITQLRESARILPQATIPFCHMAEGLRQFT